MNYLKESWLRWVGWLMLASLFAVACVFLSQWQFARRGEAVAKIDLVLANYDREAVPVEELVDPANFDPALEWRPVQLRGSFVTDAAHLVRNRPLNGQPGFLQVIPFKLSSGAIVLVETGWLPTSSDLGVPNSIPLPGNNEQTITARIRPSEPELGRDAPTGQLATISPKALADKTGLEPVQSFYVRLTKQYSESAPKLLLKPELTEGNHLSYALQWILFALMGFAALIWAIRQEMLFKRAAADPNFVVKKKRRLGDSDKEYEDSLTQ
ncbi:MAG: hypothetical protein RI933_1023 [Actinomycetota bacterium]